MHIRPVYVCLSRTLWEIQIGMLLYYISRANSVSRKLRKNGIHFLQVRLSNLSTNNVIRIM
jgi:hypothetical protein